MEIVTKEEAVKEIDAIDFMTSETPSLTEESNHIDVEMIEFMEGTPRKKPRKSQHLLRESYSR